MCALKAYKGIMIYIILLASISGCNGGVIIEYGEIIGPDNVYELYPVEYTVNIKGGSGIACQWLCKPSELGEFASPKSKTTIFTPAKVSESQSILLTVIITLDQKGPIIKSKDILLIKQNGGAVIFPNIGIGTVIIDDFGDMYTGGYFWKTADFDPSEGEDKYTAKGYRDAYISKFDESGGYLWTRAWGTTGLTEIGYTAMDGCFNIYAIGIFQGKVDLDPGPYIDEHTANGNNGISLCKFNSEGDYIWGRTWGSDNPSNWDTGNSVAVSSQGDIYVVGSFVGPTDFDPGKGEDIHYLQGDYDAYLCKFNANGDFIWCRSWGGKNTYCTALDLTVDKLGNIFVIGEYDKKVDFDPGQGSMICSSRGLSDCYLTKFDSNGIFQWTKTWGGPLTDSAECVRLDSSGYIYILGDFYEYADFDPGPWFHISISSGIFDIYLLKLDPYGKFRWVNTWGGRNAIMVKGGEYIDSTDNIYISGGFYNTADLDPGPGVNHFSTGGGCYAYLSKFNLFGEYLWSSVWGGKGSCVSGDIAINSTGNIYAAGGFFGTVDYDPGPGIKEYDIQVEGGYLIKLLPDGYW